MNHETKSNWLGVLLFIMLVYVFTDIYYQIKTMPYTQPDYFKGTLYEIK
jgi:hypothetical protein